MNKEPITNELLDKYSLHRCPVKSGCICDSLADWPYGFSPTGAKYDWSWIDTVFCICLKTRDDRLAHSVEQFHKYGLCTRVLYYRPDPPTKEIIEKLNLKEKGRYGSWESHRQVAWLAKNLFNSQLNLVFEDDVLFLPHFAPQTLEKIRYHIEKQLNPNEWDIYYLGHFPMYGNSSRGNNLWKVHSLFLHAYIENSPFIDKLINLPWTENGRVKSFGKLKEIGLDSWTKPNARQYAYEPMVAVQADMTSDTGVSNFKKKFHDNLIKFHSKHPRLIELIFMKLLLIILLIVAAAIIFIIYKLVTSSYKTSLYKKEIYKINNK